MTDTNTTVRRGPEPVDVDPGADDLRLWSVTTLIGCLDKPGLLYWAAEQAALAAVASRGSLDQRIAEEGEPAVVKWLRDARFRQPKDRRSDKDLGTAVHKWLEEYVLTGVRPTPDDEMRPLCESLDRWLEDWQPEWQAAEVTVYHPDYGYAGTLDGIFRIGGHSYIYDTKTTREHYDNRGQRKAPYPEVALQLAAYRHAPLAATWRPRRMERFRRRYYLLTEAEQQQAVPLPEVDGGICLHVTPEDAQAYPVRCDETVLRAFRYVLGAAKWHLQDSKGAIGDPLIPPETP